MGRLLFYSTALIQPGELKPVRFGHLNQLGNYNIGGSLVGNPRERTTFADYAAFLEGDREFASGFKKPSDVIPRVEKTVILWFPLHSDLKSARTNNICRLRRLS